MSEYVAINLIGEDTLEDVYRRPGLYGIRVSWSEDDFFVHGTGWGVLYRGEMFEGSNRADVIREALESTGRDEDA